VWWSGGGEMYKDSHLSTPTPIPNPLTNTPHTHSNTRPFTTTRTAGGVCESPDGVSCWAVFGEGRGGLVE